ncbi:addiction module protein [bacterium]|nr:addiction module protein [bacterium]
MPDITQIIRDAESLPVEDRARIVESLLKTLNSSDPETDRKWAEVARRRLQDLQSGSVEGVPAEAVFEKIMHKYGQ